MTGQKVAVKIMEKAKLALHRLQFKTNREIWILQRLAHPHLVKVLEAVADTHNIHVVMEYVPGGELFDQIATRGKIHENEARKYIQQLVSCVEYCHNHKIAHRDLKPENILLDEDKNVKVADLGLSNKMKSGQFLLTSCGSPNYAAPEIVSGKYASSSILDLTAAARPTSGASALYSSLC